MILEFVLVNFFPKKYLIIVKTYCFYWKFFRFTTEKNIKHLLFIFSTTSALHKGQLQPIANRKNSLIFFVFGMCNWMTTQKIFRYKLMMQKWLQCFLTVLAFLISAVTTKLCNFTHPVLRKLLIKNIKHQQQLIRFETFSLKV